MTWEKLRKGTGKLVQIFGKYERNICPLSQIYGLERNPLIELQVERDNLLEELHAIYSGAPSTTYKAYKKAQEALKKLQDMTFSDEEIDSFLPEGLKKVKD